MDRLQDVANRRSARLAPAVGVDHVHCAQALGRVQVP
jgi:hypothetical protein